jgi:pyruvate ferredoxin oxidoreductase alpha subunit
MCVVNRGVGAPWSVWNDHQDSISERDSGWIQIYVKDHQEILDTVIKAYKLSEKVCIPAMVCYDGYYLSHTYMPYDVPDQNQVDDFLPPYEYRHKLGPEKPTSLNTVTLPGGRLDINGNAAPGYMEIRRCLHMELREAIEVYTQTDDEFEAVFGRGGNPIAERYLCDDAEYVAVALGSMSNQIREAVDELRDEGLKAGLLALSLYRPFPSALPQRVRRLGTLRPKRRGRIREGAQPREFGRALRRRPVSALRVLLQAVPQEFHPRSRGQELQDL